MVVQDQKLYDFMFYRTGNGVDCAYVLPAKAVSESMFDYWESLHPGLPSPEGQIAREQVVDPANEIHKILPRPENTARPELSSPNQEAMDITQKLDQNPSSSNQVALNIIQKSLPQSRPSPKSHQSFLARRGEQLACQMTGDVLQHSRTLLRGIGSQ